MNSTPYIVTFKKAQKNKENGIKVIFEEEWYPKSKGNVYLWTFELGDDTWYYLGYHSINVNEEKFYDFSSQVEKMKELYANSECQKTVTILHWGTAKQMKKKEEELLEKVKHRFWNGGTGDYFNQKIQYTSGNQISGVDLKKVEKINKELEILKDKRTDRYHELEILNPNLIKENYSAKKLSNMDNLQVREVEKIKKLITELQFLIQTKIDNQEDIKEGAKCVVILEDRDFKLKGVETHWDKVLIAGKHTADSYGGDDNKKWTSSAVLDVIVIPKEIHQPEGGGGWNDMELWKIANGDNEKNNSVEPLTKDDIVREYEIMVDNNLDWETDEEHNRVKKLLKSKDAWKYIKIQMENYIVNKERARDNKGPRINWGISKNTHRKNLDKKLQKLNGGSDEELISNFIENGISPKDVYHKGPHTTEIVNPYVQVFGPLTTKIIKYCEENRISDKRTSNYIEEFQKSIKEIKYYLYYPNPAAKRKFATDNSHRTQIFGDGDHFLTHEYDYEILDEFQEDITT